MDEDAADDGRISRAALRTSASVRAGVAVRALLRVGSIKYFLLVSLFGKIYVVGRGEYFSFSSGFTERLQAQLQVAKVWWSDDVIYFLSTYRYRRGRTGGACSLVNFVE